MGGRFIKVAEISPEGRKNQILMNFSTAAVFNENLVQFVDFALELRKHNPDNLKQGELLSKVIYTDDKKYHMDLKENSRGRFLKVSEKFPRGHSRFQVIIPADGLEKFQVNLEELLDEYDDGEVEQALAAHNDRNNRDQIFIPADGMVEMQQNLQELIGQFDKGNGKTSQSGAQNKHVRIEGTNYYFDAKTNQQGRYMSISEVKGNSRSSILVPQSSWDSFYDGLDESIKKGFQSRA